MSETTGSQAGTQGIGAWSGTVTKSRDAVEAGCSYIGRCNSSRCPCREREFEARKDRALYLAAEDENKKLRAERDTALEQVKQAEAEAGRLRSRCQRRRW